MIVSLFALAAVAKNPCTDPDLVEQQSAVMENLYESYEATREDRQSNELISEEARKADKRKVKQVRKFDKQDKLCTGKDKWYAAWIMQSSSKLDDMKRAYELAQESMEERVPRGAWLTAYSFDRMRTADGYDQAFGTQIRLDKQNRYCLVELDGSVDDKKRQAYGVPPLKSLYRHVLDINGLDKVAPTEPKVREHSLLCDPKAVFDRKALRAQPAD